MVMMMLPINRAGREADWRNHPTRLHVTSRTPGDAPPLCTPLHASRNLSFPSTHHHRCGCVLRTRISRGLCTSTLISKNTIDVMSPRTYCYTTIPTFAAVSPNGIETLFETRLCDVRAQDVRHKTSHHFLHRKRCQIAQHLIRQRLLWNISLNTRRLARIGCGDAFLHPRPRNA